MDRKCFKFESADTGCLLRLNTTEVSANILTAHLLVPRAGAALAVLSVLSPHTGADPCGLQLCLDVHEAAVANAMPCHAIYHLPPRKHGVR